MLFDKTCSKCAYAVVRSDLEKFPWCKYECTYSDPEEKRHIPYRLPQDTCEHFHEQAGVQ